MLSRRIHEPLRDVRLDTLLDRGIIVTITIGVLFGIALRGMPGVLLYGGLGIMLFQVTSLTIARMLARRGELRRAMLIFYSGLQIGIISSAVIAPEALPILTFGVLAGFTLVLPYFDMREIRRMAVITWLTSLLIAVIVHVTPVPQASALPSLFLIATLLLCLMLVIFMLIQHHERITLTTLSRARSAELRRTRLIEIATRILSSTSIDEVAQRLKHDLYGVVNCDGFGLYLYNPAQDLLELSPIYDARPAAAYLFLANWPANVGQIGSTMQNGTALLVNNAQQHDRSVYPANQRPECNHIICAPARNTETTLGVFVLTRLSDPPFSQEEFELTQLFAAYISLAISNARLFEEQKISETKYRALFEESLDAIVITTPAGRFLDGNPAGLTLFGIPSVEEAAHIDIAHEIYVDPTDRQRFQALLERDGMVQNFEARMRRRDGQIITVLESSTAERDALGHIVAYRTIIRDITDWVRTQEEIQHIIHGVRCILWYAIVDIRDTKPFWTIEIKNPEIALDILRITCLPGESPADAFSRARHPEDRAHTDQRSTRAIYAGDRGYQQEFRWIRDDGTVGWVSESVQIEPLGNQHWRLVGVATEITQRKQAEEELRRANHQISVRVDELERQSHELAQLNAMSDLLQVTATLEEAFAVIARGVHELFPASSGAIYQISAHGTTIELMSRWGMPCTAAYTTEDCWALRRGRPHYSSPADAVLRCPHLRDAAPHGAFCIPIFAQHDLIGLLQLGFEHAWESAEQQDRHFQIAITVAEQAGLALANLRLRETLRQQAIRDPLTGLFNRRAMEESLERELSRAIRRSMPLGIILFDLDHFKNYNDTFGHAAGDALLREVGAFLQRHVRGEDIACRYGGEEFVVILSEASLEQTHARAEMLRTGLHSLGDSLRRPHAGRTTASFGVAAYPDHAARSDLLLQQADAALYRAKAAGRDCVALADDASAYRFARQSCAGGA